MKNHSRLTSDEKCREVKAWLHWVPFLLSWKHCSTLQDGILLYLWLVHHCRQILPNAQLWSSSEGHLCAWIVSDVSSSFVEMSRLNFNDDCSDFYFGVGFSGNLNKLREKLYKAVAAQIKSSGGQPSTLIASMMHKVRSKYATPLNPPFVSAFCQSNVGDTTPNTLGPYCLDSGLPCDFKHSTCNGMNELCVGRGPGYVYYYWNVFLET